MAIYSIRDLEFQYPEGDRKILDKINIDIEEGEFVVLIGQSGSGKTTLLRQLKPSLSPHGLKHGEINFGGKNLDTLDKREDSSKIGFVFQNPDNQIVTDKVWHELAFGLESLGCDTPTIRLRVAEMASYFGIENWFYKDVSDLSGGQKQLLNLASIMTMNPSVLILDEPTSQLDPIASSDFLGTIKKINRELGITVILTEHRLEETMPMADRVVVMDEGEIIADGSPSKIAREIQDKAHKMSLAMPTPMKIYAAVENGDKSPLTVRDGRSWLDKYCENHDLKELPTSQKQDKKEKATVEIEEAWFKYEKELPDVVKGVSLKAYSGELLAILGGNGTGKTTTLSLISGLNKPYRGKVYINGLGVSEISAKNRYEGVMGVLPQDPKSLFVKKTVRGDLYEIFKGKAFSKDEKDERVDRVVKLCDLGKVLNQHPYDLSGGEQQRVALAKVLLLEPSILLLDEPTKGMDADFKHHFSEILRKLMEKGTTVIMVSHDIEFCAEYADKCALFFDGGIVTEDSPEEFFPGNSFYTTAANRMARHKLKNAITADQIIRSCGAEIPQKPESDFHDYDKSTKKDSLKKKDEVEMLLKPRKKLLNESMQIEKSERILSNRTKMAALSILLLIPLTLFIGIYYLGDRKYYFISILIILETMIPFAMIFEGRKPQARELVVIAVLSAIGIAGRAAFFMLPQFKPVIAIVIISAVAFGGESGFLVGAMTMLISNMMYSQGPWMPWQMFAMGIIGFLAGVLFRKGFLRRSKWSLAIFGAFSAVIIYGGLMNPAAVLMAQSNINIEMLVTSWMVGLPFDLIHALATAFFLLIISEPMLEKLDRIKVKYGLID